VLGVIAARVVTACFGLVLWRLGAQLADRSGDVRPVDVSIALVPGTPSAASSIAPDTPEIVDDPEAAMSRALTAWRSALAAPAAERTARLVVALDDLVDYEGLTRRACGEPCRTSGCEDLWRGYDDAQRAELRLLMSELARLSLRHYAERAAELTFRGKRSAAPGGAVRIGMSLAGPPESVAVDWVLARTGSGWHVVDLIVEGSSTTKNYYAQFLKKMQDPDKGYPDIVERLRLKIATLRAKAGDGV
jgi:ABC-type transporter MlaC component